MYEMDGNGKMVLLDVPNNSVKNNLAIGSVLLWGGNQAWPSQEYAIVGRTSNDWGVNYSLISLKNYGQTSTEAHGLKYKNDKNVWHSQHFFILDKSVSTDEVLDLIEKNKIKQKHEIEAKELESMRKQTQSQKEVVANPDLVTIKNGGSATKNIKKELKKAFPKVSFSVRHKSFAGGDSIDISWNDGPLSEEVSKITDKYEEGSFDGMNDIYEYNHRETWTDNFGGAKYVHAQRDLSAKAYIYAAWKYCKSEGYKMPKITVRRSWDKKSYHAFIEDCNDVKYTEMRGRSNWTLSQSINQYAHSLDYTEIFKY